MHKILNIDKPKDFFNPILDKCSKDTSARVRKDTTSSLFNFIIKLIINNHLVLLPKSSVGVGPSETNNNLPSARGNSSNALNVPAKRRKKVWVLLLKIFAMIIFDDIDLAQYSNSAPSLSIF